MATAGIFGLTSPRDLLLKARHDIERLRSNPMDTYAAFDFFVAARHIPDWLYPTDPGKRDALFARHVELRICRHIADGAKHFQTTDPRHKQVSKTWKGHSAWAKGAWAPGVWKHGAWGEDGLFILLDPRDADTSSLGARIGALELAEKVLDIIESTVP